jgi:FkbM family methyltransferase
MSSFYDFIEIGTSDFDTLLEKSDENKRGISIDPLSYFLDRLPEKDNCKKICCAISDEEGEEDIYYITEETIKKYDLPNFVRGCGCLSDYHPFILTLLNNKSEIHPIGRKLDPSEIFSKERVKVRRLKSIIDEHSIKKIKILKIDTEGSDDKIVLDYLSCCKNEGYPMPYFIQFEHVLIDESKRGKVLSFVIEQGYHLMSSNIDDVTFKLNHVS